MLDAADLRLGRALHQRLVDLPVAAQIAVDGGGDETTLLDGLDDEADARNGIAGGEDAVRAGTVFLYLGEAAAIEHNAEILVILKAGVLAGGEHHAVAGDHRLTALLGYLSNLPRGLVVGGGQHRVNTEAGHAALCALNDLKGPTRQKVHALLRALGLIVHVGQNLICLLQTGQVDGDAFADQAAGHVVAHRARADDAYGLAQIGQVLFGAAVCQYIHGGIHLGQVSPRQRQTLALADAYGHQYGVVLLFQSRRVGDLAVYLRLDAAVQNVLDLLHHALQGKAVRGDTAGHRAAQLGTLFKYGHIVTQLVQIIGRRQAARARTDDGDLFAGALLMEALTLPALLCVILHREPLQAANADGIVDERPAAAGLAEVVADMAQHQREWDFFAYNGVGFLPGLAVPAQRLGLVLQSAGGTDLHAGAAVTALVHQRLVVGRTDKDLLVLRAVVVDSLYAADVTADPHTAPAFDAAVHIMHKKRIFTVYTEMLFKRTESPVACADILYDRLKRAFAEYRTGRAVLRML